MIKRRLFGLLGMKLEHSLSALIFNSYFRRKNLDYRYQLFDLSSQNLHQFLKKASSSPLSGLNVTIPYKERIMAYLDEIEGKAKIIGSVNVIHNEKGKLKGFNTDYKGFMRSLKNFRPGVRSQTVVLGGGGAARSVIYALHSLGIEKITFFTRSAERIKRLKDDFSFVTGLEGQLWKENKIKEKSRKAGLIINATPVGMFPGERCSPFMIDFRMRKNVLVYDLIYNPPETRFLKEARSRGAVTENGIRMLIFQAIESFKIWAKEALDEALFLKTSEEVIHASLYNRG
ncbi:MAG: shikimate dehydrogenase [Candidatus Aminicenantales bacterium]